MCDIRTLCQVYMEEDCFGKDGGTFVDTKF